jgi:hypothetical protein
MSGPNDENMQSFVGIDCAIVLLLATTSITIDLIMTRAWVQFLRVQVSRPFWTRELGPVSNQDQPYPPSRRHIVTKENMLPIPTYQWLLPCFDEH